MGLAELFRAQGPQQHLSPRERIAPWSIGGHTFALAQAGKG